MLMSHTLRGTVTNERTIELDEPIQGLHGPVELTVQPITTDQHAALSETLSPHEWRKMFHAWLDSHDPDLPVLSEAALRRDGIYEDR